MKKTTYDFLGVIFILLVISFGLLIYFPPVSALEDCGNLTLNSSITTNYNIQWNYNIQDSIIKMSIDGNLITNFDNQSGVYIYGTADGRDTGEHILKIYNNTDTGCNTSSIEQTEQEQFFGSLNYWFLIAVIITCAIIGYLSIPLIGLIGVILSLLGIATAINQSATMGIIFFVLFIVSAFSISKNS